MITNVFIAIPCLLRGGTEMQTLLLVRVLVGLNYSAQVCCYFEADPEVVREFRAAGAAVTLLGWSRTIGALAFVRGLASVIRRERPDVVHVQYVAPGLLPIVAARLAGVKNLLSTVHQPATPYHPGQARFLLRLGASLCRSFICVSQAAERSWFGGSIQFESAGGSQESPRRCTIPNGVDMHEIERILSSIDLTELRKSIGVDGHPVLGTVSRLSREKGVDILLAAFARVRATCPDTRLLIVGDGNERRQLQEEAKRLGVAESVVWAGRQPWSMAIAFMGAMDIVAVPSRFEGFGLTAAEAMACGKPVVAADVDGLPEVLGDCRAGCLVPPGQPEVMADACVALLRNQDLRLQMGAHGKERVKALYDIHIFGERYRALYRAVNRES